MRQPPNISPNILPNILNASILAADFSRLGVCVRAADKAGVDMIHIDVMDGHFVPNLTFGALAVDACRQVTDLPLDVHLMIEKPEAFLADYAAAGATSVTVHAEVGAHLHRTLEQVREHELKTGLAVNPLTPLTVVKDALPYLDMVLVMTVNPGFGGQSLIPASLDRVNTVRGWIDELGLTCHVEVDGGINAETLPKVRDAGANVFVAGSGIFGTGAAPQDDGMLAAAIAENVKSLQAALAQ
jgi:ribulose-phosphate 3-epimerase